MIDPSNHPYGVDVGERVFYWPSGSPPLSAEYVKPACIPALVVVFRNGPAPWAPEYDIWLADLAYVENGAVKVAVNVPQSESFGSSYDDQRSYGVYASWHRDVIHASEKPTGGR